MNISKEAKIWKVAETQIFQASEFLNDPDLFSLIEQPLESYATNKREKELYDAMVKLENIAKANGCKSGFWRRIKKAAIQMKQITKAEQYENEFHKALKNKST